MAVYGTVKLYIVINFSTLFCPQKQQKNSPKVKGKGIKISQVEFINAQLKLSGNQYAICGAVVLKVSLISFCLRFNICQLA